MEGKQIKPNQMIVTEVKYKYFQKIVVDLYSVVVFQCVSLHSLSACGIER